MDQTTQTGDESVRFPDRPAAITGAVLSTLMDPGLEPLFLNAPRSGVPSAWYGHVPFALWLVRALRPDIVVELGSHNGVSYAAFCEAVLLAGLKTRCYAVDTWKGDEHAGFYDESVYDSLQRFNDSRYSAFSRMLRTTFDDASRYFADGSVDLLHIDGCHSYDAVRHDFETWHPKLSDRAVVIFHDTNVRERDFGVWRLWDEFRQHLPGFEFVHSHGLGVLAFGANLPEPVRSLCNLTDPAAIAMIRGRFAHSGRLCVLEAEQQQYQTDVKHLDDARRAAADAAASLDDRIRQGDQDREHLARQLSSEQDRLAKADAAAASMSDRVAAAEREARRLHMIATHGEQHAAKKRAALDTAQAELARTTLELEAARSAIAETENRVMALRLSLTEQSAAQQAQVHQLQAQIDTLQVELGRITNSTIWRALSPVRRIALHIPPSQRRWIRRGMRALWSIVTPWRIPARLRYRREVLAGVAGQPRPAGLAPSQIAVVVQDQARATGSPEHDAAPPDRFSLDLIAPLQGDYLPAIQWYDAEEPDVSIIVLNWNRAQMTILCLQHIWQHTEGYRYEIIIVDNGSAPDDIELLEREAIFARIIPVGVNKYFGEANNIGVEAAHGRYVCLLNNDAFVTAGWLGPLVDTLATDASTGAVGPCFRYPGGALQEAGALVNPDGSVIQLGKGCGLDDSPFLLARTVDYVSAACVVVRRADFIAVLGFDLAWDPAYYEDVDLCLKLRLIGLQTVYCPKSVVTHIEHATSVNQGAALRLDNIVAINRRKFVARWGRYLETMGEEKPALIIAPEAAARSDVDYEKRILIYTPYHLTPGGGERYVLTMAEAFRGRAGVALVTRHLLSRVRLLTMAREFGLELGHVDVLSVDDLYDRPPFDLAIVLGNEIYPSRGRMALRNIFICQFPFPVDPGYLASVRRFWNDYDLVVTYSEYVRSHVQRLATVYELPPRKVVVLAPPVQLSAPSYAKKPNQILHVGRFFTGGHCKKQDVMIEAFRSLVEQGVTAELHFAGSTMPEAEHRAFYAGLIDQARGLPVHFHANCSNADLQRLFADSAVYWHATGLGEDVGQNPHVVEHFGISVVEAMSARCIPIVFAAGGPASIIEDGITGFHFHSIDELSTITRQVLTETSAATLDSIANAAAAAAQAYDESVFREKTLQMCFTLLNAWKTGAADAAATLA